MDKPLVTVLMPVFNAERYLADAINSILNQTFTNFEFLIINDGSTDRSEEIIRSFTDDRIRLIRNESNIKLIATLNKGIELAQGAYIARMDADDISLPERLEKQVAFMENRQDIGVCGTWFEMFGQTNWVSKYPVDDKDIRLMLLYQSPFCHPSVLIRRSLLIETGIRFDKNYIHAEDFIFWVQLAHYTLFANIPEILLRYRMHEEGVSHSHRQIQEANTYKIIKLQFDLMGVAMSDNDIDLYINIAHATFRADKIYIEQAEQLLLTIAEANKKTEYLPVGLVNTYIGEKWFHICTNATGLGLWIYKKYTGSPLSALTKTSWTNQLKMLMKSIIPERKNRLD